MKKKYLYCLPLLLIVFILFSLKVAATDEQKIEIQAASAGTTSGGTMNLANTYDGNPQTKSNVSFNPIGGPQAFYTYDLGDVYDLSKVYINFSTTRAHFYKIMVSNNGVNFSLAYEKLSGVYPVTDIDGTNYYIQDINLSSVQARYIKIICYATEAQAHTGSHGAWYDLAEVEFYGKKATTIIPDPIGGKLDIVAATSGNPQAGTIVITRTYDGYLNTNTDVQWRPIGGPEAYYTYDLGKVCAITRVHLNFHTFQANFYKVQVSDDGDRYETVYENLGDVYGTTNIDGVEYYIEEFDLTDVKGRYVKIIPYATARQAYDGISGEWARLAEVAFYGSLYEEDQPETQEKTEIIGEKITIADASHGKPRVGNIEISRTYDGNLESHTDVLWSPIGGPEAFYIYDLAQIYDISHIYLNFHIFQANFYRIEVSDNGKDFSLAYENLDNAYGPTEVNGVNYYIQNISLENVSGRYIKIIPYATTRVAYDGLAEEWSRLAEVAFYGSLSGRPNPSTSDGIGLLVFVILSCLPLSLKRRKSLV